MPMALPVGCPEDRVGSPVDSNALDLTGSCRDAPGEGVVAVTADLGTGMPVLTGRESPAKAANAPVPGRLPLLSVLDPYSVGAYPSAWGDATRYRKRDFYVRRAADEPLRAALLPGRLVVVVGPPAVGKTRTAFEVLRAHEDWRYALLATATPRSIGQLAEHPDMSSRDPLVIWLDDLTRFLPPAGPLSEVGVSRLLKRPGPVVLIGTMRASDRNMLQERDIGFTREARRVLDGATWITLASTGEDPAEQARAAATYPEVGVGVGADGLAETLVGLPELLRRYHDASVTDSLMCTIVQACVDWARCGIRRPIPEADLRALARNAAESLGASFADNEFDMALHRARAAVAAQGHAALLAPGQLPDGSRGYVAAGFLAAADDGQGGHRTRPVSQLTWRRVLDKASSEETLSVGLAAYRYGNVPVAIAANRRAAAEGHSEAHFNLGVLLADCLNPPDLAEARRWWTLAAEAGHTEAQLSLGMLLANRLDPPDLAEARRWWTLAAEAGHTEAQLSLGMLLANRLDPPDLAGARNWWMLAGQAGDADACFNLGVLLADRLDPPDLAGARNWYTKAAEAGNANAAFNLGTLLANRMMPPDLTQARAWWARAGQAGHLGAQFNLGLLYTKALNPPDLTQARAWWTRAADAGDTEAQYSLGGLLADRLDPPDLAGARWWWERAAEGGHVRAAYALGRLLAVRLDPPDLAGARQWWTRAAEGGDVDAQFNLGVLFAEWLNPPNLAEALRWWTRAADAGDTEAPYSLGGLLADRLDPPDLAGARWWWERAAEGGHVRAAYDLGRLLAVRLDPPDLAGARQWWTRAAEAGDVDAQFNLGVLFAELLNPPNLAEALRWWKRAADAGDTEAQYSLEHLPTWES
jgi:TPR repeat protein